MFSRIVFILTSLVLATVAGLSGNARTEQSSSQLGKPAFTHVTRVASLPWRLDSSLGKPSQPILREGPPPRGAGPGLRFDTRRYFYVYSDDRSPANHYAPSGWMGDYADIEVDPASAASPADGRTCLRVRYLGRGQAHNWAGIYWQEPQNNWGERPGGFDLRGMTRLTFWARGERGGERIALLSAGGIMGAVPDSGIAQIGPVDLRKEWTQYFIDLHGIDLTKISGGFAWSVGRFDNDGPITFYLDEIRYEVEGGGWIGAADRVAQWYGRVPLQ